MQERRTDRNAEKLSAAVVHALRNHNAPAEVLTAGATPSSGRIARGIFYSLDNTGHLISIPFLSSNSGPNVEVTVTIADAAKDANTPLAVIGDDATLKGQSGAAG